MSDHVNIVIIKLPQTLSFEPPKVNHIVIHIWLTISRSYRYWLSVSPRKLFKVGNHVTLLHKKFVRLKWPIQISNFSTILVPWEFHGMPYLGCNKSCEKVQLYAEINVHERERERVNCGGSMGYCILSIVVMYFMIHTLLFMWKENMISFMTKESHLLSTYVKVDGKRQVST